MLKHNKTGLSRFVSPGLALTNISNTDQLGIEENVIVSITIRLQISFPDCHGEL
jgi:hypothetical protein